MNIFTKNKKSSRRTNFSCIIFAPTFWEEIFKYVKKLGLDAFYYIGKIIEVVIDLFLKLK